MFAFAFDYQQPEDERFERKGSVLHIKEVLEILTFSRFLVIIIILK